MATCNNRPDDGNGDGVGDDDDDDTMDAVASTTDRSRRTPRPVAPLARPGPLLPRPRDLLFSRNNASSSITAAQRGIPENPFRASHDLRQRGINIILAKYAIAIRKS